MIIYIRFEEHTYASGMRDLAREVELGPFEYVEIENLEVRTDQHENEPLAALNPLDRDWHYEVMGQEGVFHQYTIYSKEN